MTAMPDDFDNSPPSFSAARKFGTGFGVLVGIAAFLAIVVMVNFIAARHFRRLPLSEDRVPPLAPVTLRSSVRLPTTCKSRSSMTRRKHFTRPFSKRSANTPPPARA